MLGHALFAAILLLAMLLFWGGVAALAVWAVRAFVATRPLPPPPLTPRQILDERLARGETTVADYEKARAALDRASLERAE